MHGDVINALPDSLWRASELLEPERLRGARQNTVKVLVVVAGSSAAAAAGPLGNHDDNELAATAYRFRTDASHRVAISVGYGNASLVSGAHANAFGGRQQQQHHGAFMWD